MYPMKPQEPKMNPAEMTDTKLILTIRKIEASPSAHRTAKIARMVAANLQALRAEAARRNLNA